MIETKKEFESFVSNNWNKINEFIDDKFRGKTAPFTNSVDIREGREKIAPVDNNLYPAGFNNVCTLDLLVSKDRLAQLIQKTAPGAKNLVIIPESHTKNLFYLDHLHTLKEILKRQDQEPIIATPDESLFDESKSPLQLTSHSGHSITMQFLKVSDGELYCKESGPFDLCVINNDQSSPLPVEWEKIKTKVVPTPKLGWTNRQKSQHFEFYSEAVDEFCQHFDIYPDLLQARFQVVEDVDFHDKKNLDLLAEAVRTIQEKTKRPGAKVFLKASQGTYGMGISVVSSPEEVLKMNRKGRNKMDVGKNRLKFTKVIVQEAVETVLSYEGGPAEVSIYLVDGRSVGGFMRANPLRGDEENLNSKGMVYQKFCISEIQQNSDHKEKEAAYSVVARLSSLAAAREIDAFKA